MSNCPHRRPGGIVGSYIDENEPCAQCEREAIEDKAYWRGVRAALLVAAVCAIVVGVFV
jgi:uncharacterized protein (DUF983 family)